MNTFAINGARKPSRIGSLAIVSGAVLGSMGIVGPALSADLPPYDTTPYPPAYHHDFYYGCYRDHRCAWWGWRDVAERLPVVEWIPVAERHWVQRDYIERRFPPYYYYMPGYGYPAYPGYYPPGRGYPDYPGRYHHYSYYYPGPGVDPDPAYDRAARSEPRRLSSYVQYPPVPAAYHSEAEPRLPYWYIASSDPYDYRPGYEYDYYKPSYEYQPSLRPPATVPGGPGHPRFPQ